MRAQRKYKDYKVRPRFQRAFFEWFKANGSRFLTPILISNRTDKRIRFNFVKVPSAISGYLTSCEVSVLVTIHGEFYDYIFSVDIQINKDSSGYFCTLCSQDAAKYFTNREVIWIDHLFDPLLTWVNNILTPACFLRVSSLRGGGCTAAALVRNDSQRDRSFSDKLFPISLKQQTPEQATNSQIEEWQERFIALKCDNSPAEPEKFKCEPLKATDFCR